MESKKILILAHKPPYPKIDGGCIAIAQTLESLLEKEFQVDFLCMETHKHKSQAPISKANLNYKVVPVDTKVKPIPALLNLLTKRSYILSRFQQNSFQTELEKLLANNTYETIIFESLFTALYINTVDKHSRATKIYRSHNVEYLIWEGKREFAPNAFLKKYYRMQARRLKKEEMGLWRKFNSIASISDADSAHIRKYCNAKVSTLNIAFADTNTSEKPLGNTIDFFHLGAMDWQPNIEAMNWLLNDIWPKFTTKNKKAQLHIAGRSMPKSLLQKDRLGYTNHNEISNASTFIQQHKVMLVPLRAGSGLRIKIIEGLALGKCIIATELALAGIPFTNYKNAIVANTQREFIDAMQFCWDQPEKVNEIGLQAKELAQKNFSKSAFNQQLEALL